MNPFRALIRWAQHHVAVRNKRLVVSVDPVGTKFSVMAEYNNTWHQLFMEDTEDETMIQTLALIQKWLMVRHELSRFTAWSIVSDRIPDFAVHVAWSRLVVAGYITTEKDLHVN